MSKAELANASNKLVMALNDAQRHVDDLMSLVRGNCDGDWKIRK